MPEVQSWAGPGGGRIPTSLVGSYAQPNWLIDRERLRDRFPPRVRATELWRVDPRYLEEAQDDATLLAIGDQERAGLDIITDGEMRRESYSNRFATALDGVDIDTSRHRAGPQRPSEPGPSRHGSDRQAAARRRCETSSSCAHTRASRSRSRCPAHSRCPSRRRTTSMAHREAVGAAYARAVRRRDQSTCSPPAPTSSRSTSPTCRRVRRRRGQYGVDVLNEAIERRHGTIAVHICFGYAAIIHDRPSGYSFLGELAETRADQVSIETAQSGLDLAVLESLPDKTIILGVLDLSTDEVETPRRSRSGSAARSLTCARAGSWRRPTAE